MILRSEVTQVIVDTVESLGYPCGLHTAPANVGWRSGEPNTDEYVPYCVVKTGAMRTDRKPLKTESWDWSLAYQVTGWSPDPTVTDDMIGFVAERFNRFGRCSVTNYVIEHVMVEQVAAVTANKQFNPYLWQATLQMTVYAMKSPQRSLTVTRKQTP